jgi:prepilin-type N-terminal cleavage/methylation domain-containing protein
MTSPIGRMKKRVESGFTLIELILVTVLLLVFVGLTVPQFRQGFRRFADERSASEMEDLSRYARVMAVQRGVPYQMSFSEKDGSYRLRRAEKGGFVPVAGRIGLWRNLPDEARVQGSSRDVTYFPNGTAEGGPLEFWRASEPLWTMMIDPVLGETLFVEPPHETAG